MSFNIVGIKVVTDYTDHSSTLCFQLKVPVADAAAVKVYKALTAGAWADVEGGITTAVKASAPVPIQSLVAKLLEAYSGAAPSAGGTADKASADQSPDTAEGGGSTPAGS